MIIAISHRPTVNNYKITKIVKYLVINIIQVGDTPYALQFFISYSLTNKEWSISLFPIFINSIK